MVDEADRLIVRTRRIPDPGDLLARLPTGAPLAWVRHGDGLVGWGEAARLDIPAGEDRFTTGEKWLRELFDGADIDDEVSSPGSGPVAFGCFTFDPACDGSALIVPAVVLVRRAGVAWLTTTSPDAVLPMSAPRVPPTDLRWSDGSRSAPGWVRTVAASVDRIRAGALRKVVLARDLRVTASAEIDVRVLLDRLAAWAPDCYTFACDGLVGATPELLIRREGDRVSALILAGTAARGGTRAEDEALSAGLLASAKDAEEHKYAVDSVREVLGPRCQHLDVPEAPSLIRLADLVHLGTAVSGTLRTSAAQARTSALGLAAQLHPTAAVCGTPTEPALELIREVEGMDRGRYAGPVGWVDATGNGEWGIALRCGQISGATATLYAGCGIVAGSDPDAELAEAQVKFTTMRRALEG